MKVSEQDSLMSSKSLMAVVFQMCGVRFNPHFTTVGVLLHQAYTSMPMRCVTSCMQQHRLPHDVCACDITLYIYDLKL